MIEKIITGDLGVNTYLYSYNNSKLLIIDPGADTEGIVELIESRSYTPVAIILTHGHFDHIGAVEELRNRYSIPVMIHTGDANYLGESGEESHRVMFQSMGPTGDYYFNTYFSEIGSADRELKEGDDILDSGLKVIHTPGHSPGSICLYNKKEHILISGDTLFCNGLGRTDFSGGDYDTLIASISRLRTLPGDTVVYPGHGVETTIRRELG